VTILPPSLFYQHVVSFGFDLDLMAANDTSKYFTREIQCCKDKISLRIKQMCVGDVGCVVWDAALVLSAFLEQETYFPPSFWIGKRVIELGAGTGVVGLAAAAHG